MAHQQTAAKRDSANQPDILPIGELAELGKNGGLAGNEWLTCQTLGKMANLPEMNGQLANFEKEWHPGRINNNSTQAGFKQRS